jgi:uncharacterized protein (TIGR03435 family)
MQRALSRWLAAVIIAALLFPELNYRRIEASQSGTVMPSFEVASVKPHVTPIDPAKTDTHLVGCYGTDTSWPTESRVPLGQCAFPSVTLKALIAFAFQEDPSRISGGPNWLETNRYDIEAKADRAVPLAELRQMLQSLLMDRFKLQIHHEATQEAIYALVLGKNGSSLKPSTKDERSASFWSSGRDRNNFRLTVENRPLSDLVMRLQNGQPGHPLPPLGRPVIDKTGLTGNFDYTLDLEWVLDTNGARDPNATPVFAALETQLGLELQPQTAALDAIVIDRIEKPYPQYRDYP